jgi:hypothetical protein
MVMTTHVSRRGAAFARSAKAASVDPFHVRDASLEWDVAERSGYRNVCGERWCVADGHCEWTGGVHLRDATAAAATGARYRTPRGHFVTDQEYDR